MKRRIGNSPRSRPNRALGSRSVKWISVQVELIEGHGEHYWPRPGRIFAAADHHSFAQLASAIDDAFARWDRSHLHEFELSDGTRIGMTDPEWDAEESVVDERILKIARLKLGEHLRLSASFPTDPCRTSDGVRSLISTAVHGVPMMAKPSYRQTLSSLTSHLFDQAGDLAADLAVESSQDERRRGIRAQSSGLRAQGPGSRYMSYGPPRIRRALHNANRVRWRRGGHILDSRM